MPVTHLRLLGGLLLAGAVGLAAGAASAQPGPGTTSPTTRSPAATERPDMWMSIGTRRFAVTLEDNPTARAFAQRLPLTLDMPDLNGNEKHVTLARPLPANAVRAGSIRAGDVMLYGDATLVVFYESFRSSYSYTRIGRVEDSTGLAQALGPGEQRISFTLR